MTLFPPEKNALLQWAAVFNMCLSSRRLILWFKFCFFTRFLSCPIRYSKSDTEVSATVICNINFNIVVT